MNYIAIIALLLCLIYGYKNITEGNWHWVSFYAILTVINIYSIIKGGC